MAQPARQLGPRTQDNLFWGLARGRLLVPVLVLWILGLLCGRIAQAPPTVSDAPIVSAGASARIAIADFDQDGRPDVATISTERDGALAADYQVLVRLSSSGYQSFHIIAASGGLGIRAVDVNNGNHFIDLVIATAVSKRPVAILINDGSGHFSPVQPSAFPDAFSDERAGPTFTPGQTIREISVPLQQRPAGHSQSRCTLSGRLQTDVIPRGSQVLLHASPATSHDGRAPPA